MRETTLIKEFQTELYWEGRNGLPSHNIDLNIPGKVSLHLSPDLETGDRLHSVELFASSIAASQMLMYVDLCHKNEIVISRYIDRVCVHMNCDASGRMSIGKILLRPQIYFISPDNDSLRARAIHLIHEAKDECLIASMVQTKIDIEPGFHYI